MKYKITTDAYPLFGIVLGRHLPAIPDTTRIMVLDTESGIGKELWWEYLGMRGQQKTGIKTDPWLVVKELEEATEIVKFREAINFFLVFMAGDTRDTAEQVTRIEPCDDAGISGLPAHQVHPLMFASP